MELTEHDDLNPHLGNMDAIDAVADEGFIQGGALVLDWNINAVLGWLSEKGFAELVPMFKMHTIDGAVLPKLNDRLLREIGITNVGTRVQVMNEVVKIQAIARAQQRSGMIWTDEQYRAGPCSGSLPFGFPFCCECMHGRPDLYTLYNSKLNIMQSEKVCNTPCTGCCGYLIKSNNVDLSLIIDIDTDASSTAVGDPVGFIQISTMDGNYYVLSMRSSECQKITALISNAKEEAQILQHMQTMNMVR
eukprot:CAMPEP_0181287920 /NCGR_PEP_ID=MMETSP1101-20121128/51_1 /TAXON_ID=46948 /ORGANISM="Rhodomonas abbreviata, Strain Caron Lab Isolate" /LENGTH=246 /DNA_ID=CAMNT_0023391997 /DNA_START=66 /DNA_END=806 /DNA_ORIENTATION=-